MTPSQPSPTNLSDELRGRLATILTHTWYLHTELRCADKTGKKKEDVLIPGSQFQVTPSDKTLDEVLSAITTAYAEAINEVIGSDEQHAAYTDNNEAYNGSVFTRNHLRAEQRQRLKGLLPNGKDGDASS